MSRAQMVGFSLALGLGMGFAWSVIARERVLGIWVATVVFVSTFNARDERPGDVLQRAMLTSVVIATANLYLRSIRAG